MFNMKLLHVKKNNPGDVINISLPGIPFEIILDNDFLLGNKSMDGTRHTHPVFDVHFASKGSFVVSFKNYEVTVQEGETVVISPNIYHGIYVETGESITNSFEFAVNDKEYVKAKLDIKNITNACLTANNDYFLFKLPMLENIIADVVSEYVIRDCLSQYRIQTLMGNVIIEIIRNISCNCEIKKKVYLVSETKECDKKYIIDTYFRENGNNPEASRTDLSNMLFITTRHLDRIMQQMYNCTFSQKLMSDRIENAKSLLECTNVPIEDIVNSIGLTSYEYFYRCFKKIMGITPGQYRKTTRRA